MTSTCKCLGTGILSDCSYSWFFCPWCKAGERAAKRDERRRKIDAAKESVARLSSLKSSKEYD